MTSTVLPFELRDDVARAWPRCRSACSRSRERPRRGRAAGRARRPRRRPRAPPRRPTCPSSSPPCRSEGLIEMPPVSKVTPLPTSPMRSPSPAPYRNAISRGSVSRPLGDGDEPAHAPRRDRRRGRAPRPRPSVRRGDLLRPLGEPLGRKLVRGQVLELAGAVRRLGADEAIGRLGLEPCVGRPGARSPAARDAGGGGPRVRRAIAVEAIVGEHGALGQRAAAPGRSPASGSTQAIERASRSRPARRRAPRQPEGARHRAPRAGRARDQRPRRRSGRSTATCESRLESPRRGSRAARPATRRHQHATRPGRRRVRRAPTSDLHLHGARVYSERPGSLD